MALFDIFGIGSSPDYLSGFMSEEERRRLQERAGQNALLQAGLGMLSQSGYSTTPVSLGQILGAGGQAGLAGYQGTMDRGVQELITRQKLADAKLARDRAMQIRALAPQLYKTVPEVTREVQEPGMNVPVPPQEGAVAPNFQTQYQPGQTTTEVVAPARRVINEQVLGQIAALQEDPLAALKTQAEIMPKLRAAGMTESGMGENPFAIWAQGSSSPTVQKLANQYASAFQRGTLTDPDKINTTLNNLATMDEKFIGRQEQGARDERQFQQNLELRDQANKSLQAYRAESLELRRTLGGTGGNDMLTPDAQLMMAQVFNQTGTLPTLGAGKNASLMKANIINMAQQLQGGVDPVTAARNVITNKQNTDAQKFALRNFNTGQVGNTTRSLNVAMSHLDTLEKASLALRNGDIRAFNSIGNTIQREIGAPAPTNFDAVKKIVAGELVKATTGSAGALGDRQEVERSINSANSEAQLLDAIAKYKELIAGQLGGLETQYTSSTLRPAEEFRAKLLPATRNILNSVLPIQQSIVQPSATPSKAQTPAPKGVPQDLWNVMTEEEKKLWK